MEEHYIFKRNDIAIMPIIMEGEPYPSPKFCLMKRNRAFENFSEESPRKIMQVLRLKIFNFKIRYDQINRYQKASPYLTLTYYFNHLIFLLNLSVHHQIFG